MRVEVVQTTFEHVIEICETMRDRERKAFEKLGENPERMITQELTKSLYAWTGLVDDRVVAVIGVLTTGVLSDEGYVWMVVSKNAKHYPMIFLRRGREHLEFMQKLFKRIYGFVSNDFECSIKWLEWLGFTIHEANNGVRRFEWIRQP